jgi:hypothetical protein
MGHQRRKSQANGFETVSICMPYNLPKMSQVKRFHLQILRMQDTMTLQLENGGAHKFRF